MPELPEIETIKCYLEKHIVNRRIKNYSQKRSNIRYELAGDLKYLTEGNKISTLQRRAKYLILDLDNSYSIIVHLGMSGRFILAPSEYELQKHDHIQFILEDGQQLIFNDARRFGMIYCVSSSDVYFGDFFKNLGPEPLLESFNTQYLAKCLKHKRVPVKNAIMDNKIVVGVGNIYASESLFLAKINPARASCSLNLDELKRLVSAIKQILTKAIASGGTTLKDFVSGDNRPGYFKQELACYGRENLPCHRCSMLIKKINQAGRATYFCSKCQN
jgi:formamidopyrimidine-DNA glycosylase